MREHAWNTRNDHALLWMAASSSLTPGVVGDWHTVSPAGTLVPGGVPATAAYSMVFEATCNSLLHYDPARRARVVTAHFNGTAPTVLVALVAPSLEVPVATQHAIAYETCLALGCARVDVVTASERPSAQSASKARKAALDDRAEPATPLDEALDIVAGKKRGATVDVTARAFVHAYTSRARRRDPFRCTPLQLKIIRVVASGAIAPTTHAIARAVHTTENKVNDSITELVDALVPRAADEPERRDSRERLYWLMHHYGVWVRLVEGRAERTTL